MKIIVAASQKGGSGKTTIIRSLAVAAHQRLGAVAILDTDPQGSLTSWWNRREAQEPLLVKIDPDDFEAGVARLEAADLKYLFIDTPPSIHPQVEKLLAHATLAVVPVRPSPDDLDAVGGTLALIEAAGCPFVFVLNQAKPRTRLQMQAVMALAKNGKLAPTIIHERTDFPTAAITGKTVTEIEQESLSATEVRDVLGYVLTQFRTSTSTHVHKQVANG